MTAGRAEWLLNRNEEFWFDDPYSHRSSNKADSTDPEAKPVFEVDCDGVRVRGEITYRSLSDLSVRITSPYSGLSTCSHYMYMPEEYGTIRAREMLIELYKKAASLASKKSIVKNVIDEYRIEKQHVEKEKEAVREKKRAYKKQFKENRIDQKAYQAEIKAWKEEIFRLECGLRDFFSSKWKDADEECCAMLENRMRKEGCFLIPMDKFSTQEIAELEAFIDGL